LSWKFGASAQLCDGLYRVVLPVAERLLRNRFGASVALAAAGSPVARHAAAGAV
jgi:hypothetical protein